MTEETKAIKIPVKEWDKEKRESVVNEFLEDVVEHIDNTLIISDDVRDMLDDGYGICLIVKKDGTDTYYSREDVV